MPIDISSSISLLGIWYFFTICATNLRFLSIKIPLAFLSPAFNNSKYFCSSFSSKGCGNVLLPEMYPAKNTLAHNNSNILPITITKLPPSSAYYIIW